MSRERRRKAAGAQSKNPKKQASDEDVDGCKDAEWLNKPV